MSRAFLFGFLLVPMYVACSSDDFNDPSSNGGTDAGQDSTSETGTGGSSGTGATGGGGSGADAGTEAEAGPVRWPVHVEVVHHDTAGTTVEVLSSLADGSVDALTPLDASGKMDVEVVDGGSVHLLVKTSKLVNSTVVVDRKVYSYYSIDQERSVVRALDPGVPSTVVGDITFYPDGTFPGGTSYVRVWPSCNGNKANAGNPYAGIPFLDMLACENATEYWAAVIAFNAAGAPISAQLLEHKPVAASPTTVYISFGTPASYVTKKTNFAPVPADATLLGVSVAAESPTGTTYGDKPLTVLFSNAAPVATANGSISVPVVTKNIPAFVVTETIGWADIGLVARSTRRTQRVTSLADSTWDPTGPTRFASLSDLDVTDVERPSISWTLESSGVMGSCTEASSAWLVGEEWTYWQGRNLGAASGTVQFPELPAEVAGFAPSAGATVDSTFATHFSPTAGTGDCLTYDQNQLDFATVASGPM